MTGQGANSAFASAGTELSSLASDAYATTNASDQGAEANQTNGPSRVGQEPGDALDHLALMGAKARLVLDLRERMEHQRAGRTEGEAK